MYPDIDCYHTVNRSQTVIIYFNLEQKKRGLCCDVNWRWFNRLRNKLKKKKEEKKKKCVPTVEMLMLLGLENNEGKTKSVLGW